jgi:hypothetical protein
MPDQIARDESYLRSMSKPLYFVQTCAGEVTRIFHPLGEDAAVLNMKKSFLQTISLRMSDDKSAAHVEEHHDNHGKRSVAYEYANGATDAEMTVTTAHDTVHNIDSGAFSHRKRYIQARVADDYVHTFADGVVKEVRHQSVMEYPQKRARDVGASTHQFSGESAEPEKLTGASAGRELGGVRGDRPHAGAPLAACAAAPPPTSRRRTRSTACCRTSSAATRSTLRTPTRSSTCRSCRRWRRRCSTQSPTSTTSTSSCARRRPCSRPTSPPTRRALSASCAPCSPLRRWTRCRA